MRSGAELKVGLVVVAALVVLGVIVYYFIGMYAARLGYPLEVVFDRAEVRPGDNVTMAGVSVGRVEAVGLTRDNHALVRLRLHPGVKVHRGYTVHIVPGALLGEKFVEIRPVTGKQAGAVLRPGARIKGERYVRIEDLLADAQTLLGGLTGAVQSLTRLVADKEMRAGLERSMASLEMAARNMGELAQALRGMARESRPQVRAVLANMEQVTSDLRKASQVLSRTAVESEVPQELEEAARRLRSAMERVDDIAAQLQEMVADPEMADLLRTAGRNLRDTSDSIRQAGEEIRAAAANARSASGSVEQAAKDVPTITGNMREASANIRDASAEIKDMTHEAHGALSDVTGRAAKAAEVIQELPHIAVGLDVGTQYLTQDDRWWVDANLDLTSGPRSLRVGVADIGEQDHFNFQLGQALGPGRIRYGIVESDVGVGYDWPVTPWLTLSAEAFDPNNLQANVFGYWGLGGVAKGWSAVVGYRGAGASGSPVVGIRAQK